MHNSGTDTTNSPQMASGVPDRLVRFHIHRAILSRRSDNIMTRVALSYSCEKTGFVSRSVWRVGIVVRQDQPACGSGWMWEQNPKRLVPLVASVDETYVGSEGWTLKPSALAISLLLAQTGKGSVHENNAMVACAEISCSIRKSHVSCRMPCLSSKANEGRAPTVAL